MANVVGAEDTDATAASELTPWETDPRMTGCELVLM